tara:strand:- start:15162 stop:16370 length:1209 start_codon:yes stop_codon:yes gene_type:complete
MKNQTLNIKNDFPIFKNQKSLIYFDNASTTQKPQCMIDAVSEFYTHQNANVHRGTYRIAENATKKFENSRETISRFIKAKTHEIVFTKSTTESINAIAYTIGMQLKKNDEIIISEMEHHSNIVPWQMLIKEKGIKLKYIPLNKNYELNIAKLESLISKKTKLISITHMSNVLGVINPIQKIINIAKENNILTLIDAAQSIAHLKIDVKKLNCDILVFSGHKILGPTGVGVLYIKENLMKKISPFLRGGHMISEVKKYDSTWNVHPWKFEAGTLNIAQIIGLSSSINYINNIGLNNILNYEKKLLDYLLNQLHSIQDIEIYGHNSNQSGPVVAFNIKNCHPFDLCKLLDVHNIAIRAGHHCTQILMQKLKIQSSNRISLYAYNTIDEIDFFIKRLNEIIKIIK